MLSKIFETVKYTLVAVNFLFVITGIIILAVGSSVQAAYNNFHVFLSERFFSLPAFCIATGIIIFLIAALGFIGAFLENYKVNMVFAGAMVLIFVFQLSACIAGFALKGNTLALVQRSLRDTMELYNKTHEVTKLWDIVQQDFECCGVTDDSDWFPHLEDQLPMSCCNIPPGTVHIFSCTPAFSHNATCSEAFGRWVKGHAASIGVAGIFLVLLQALAVAGALWLAKMIREDTVNY